MPSRPPKDAVRAGGNALDAAAVAGAMLAVVYPQCTIGGDLIALVRDRSGVTHAVLAARAALGAIAEVARTASARRSDTHY